MRIEEHHVVAARGYIAKRYGDEDLAQETALRLLVAARRGVEIEEDKLLNYAGVIAANVRRDQGRKRARRLDPLPLTHADYVRDPSEPPLAALVRRQLVELALRTASTEKRRKALESVLAGEPAGRACGPKCLRFNALRAARERLDAILKH